MEFERLLRVVLVKKWPTCLRVPKQQRREVEHNLTAGFWLETSRRRELASPRHQGERTTRICESEYLTVPQGRAALAASMTRN